MVVAVIVAEPCATAVTRPVALIVAMPGVPLTHVTVWFVAFDGVIAAANCRV